MSRFPFFRTVSVALLVGLIVSACATERGSRSTTNQAVGATEPKRPSMDGLGPNFVVTALQESLDVLGYDVGPIDGVVGVQTHDAVSAFQTDSGLDASGRVDGDTVIALAEASPEASFYVVEAVQTQLAELGYYSGLIDGDFGDGTRAALVAFHDEHSIGGGGEIGPETLTKLSDVYIEEVVLPTLEANGYEHPDTPPDTSGFLRQGDESPEVQELQEELEGLGYRPGGTDGRFGSHTTSAVLAFQKREGLDRDGIVGPGVLDALDNPQGSGPHSTSGPRVEVDLDRQIAFVIDSASSYTTINISSGSGRDYENADGSTSVAYTPTGDFSIERSIDDVREAPLGSLYRPHYFKEGWAIHGAANVPAYPASHGCIRTSNYDQDFLFPMVAVGDPVVIYGTSLGSPDDGGAGF